MIRGSICKRLHGSQGEFDLSVEMDVKQGEFVAFFGVSGVGKTTLLRCLAGLEAPEGGKLQFEDEIWLDVAAGICMPPQHRRVGYVFQDFALFPNMTVRGNLEFALRKGADRKRVDELLELMELGGMQQRTPDQLSGGQKQRVALARALASEPRLLLLDEPLSALDAEIRLRLQDEILRVQKHYGLTTILVSHDVGEVYKLAGRVMMMEAGRIVKQGIPSQVFSEGRSSGKFRFTGEILAIEAMDVMYSVTVLVGNQIVQVVATGEEVAPLKVGSKVQLVSKAFNPMLMPIATP